MRTDYLPRECVPVAAGPLGKGQAGSQLTLMQLGKTPSAVMPDKLRQEDFEATGRLPLLGAQ